MLTDLSFTVMSHEVSTPQPFRSAVAAAPEPSATTYSSFSSLQHNSKGYFTGPYATHPSPVVAHTSPVDSTLSSRASTSFQSRSRRGSTDDDSSFASVGIAVVGQAPPMRRPVSAPFPTQLTIAVPDVVVASAPVAYVGHVNHDQPNVVLEWLDDLPNRAAVVAWRRLDYLPLPALSDYQQRKRGWRRGVRRSLQLVPIVGRCLLCLLLDMTGLLPRDPQWARRATAFIIILLACLHGLFLEAGLVAVNWGALLSVSSGHIGLLLASWQQRWYSPLDRLQRQVKLLQAAADRAFVFHKQATQLTNCFVQMNAELNAACWTRNAKLLQDAAPTIQNLERLVAGCTWILSKTQRPGKRVFAVGAEHWSQWFAERHALLTDFCRDLRLSVPPFDFIVVSSLRVSQLIIVQLDEKEFDIKRSAWIASGAADDEREEAELPEEHLPANSVDFRRAAVLLFTPRSRSLVSEQSAVHSSSDDDDLDDDYKEASAVLPDGE